MEQNPQVRVGVGVIVRREGQVLLGLRQGSHGAGLWAFPGGHMEFGESVESCSIRETEEETGLTVRPVARGPYTVDLFPVEGKHYVTLYLVADAPDSGEAELREDKCARWAWFPWDRLPHPLFPGIEDLGRMGFDPFSLDPVWHRMSRSE